jgi:hypothetical protein
MCWSSFWPRATARAETQLKGEVKVPNQPLDAGVHGVREQSTTQALYSRPMPGGGYVRVELLVSEPANLAVERLRGRVVMERRSYALPALEDEQLVVEEVEGDDANVVVAELFRIARDNAAIARRVLRRKAASVRAN